MVSRRLLRIKILQILYAYFKKQENSIEKSEKELFISINKTYELYNYLLLLIIDLVHFADNKISFGKEKMVPSYNDLHPNTKFIDNKFIKQLSENKQFNKYINNTKISWANYPELIKKMYLELIGSNFYNNYLNSTDSSYLEDKDFIIKIYKNVIANSEDLYQTLEEQCIYWNDDIEFVISMIIKTIKNFNEEFNENYQLFDLYKNEEDIEFTKTLFRKTIIHHDENRQLIEKYAKNWDIERIAFVDILIMELALVEITEISSVPIKVSFNEYIEIAKYYSTDKSSNFINGILDKIIKLLKQDNKVKKIGRGLIGEA